MTKFREKYSNLGKAHLITILNLIVNLIFAFLPIFVSGASIASKNNTSVMKEIENIFYADAMFLYCSSFIAPLIILSFAIAFSKKRKNYKLYPFALIGSLYVLVVGPLMYSGVFARNLFSLGGSTPILFPTNADISILIATLIVWYYCIFIDKYIPNSPVDEYESEMNDAFEKFDEAIK